MHEINSRGKRHLCLCTHNTDGIWWCRISGSNRVGWSRNGIALLWLRISLGRSTRMFSKPSLKLAENLSKKSVLGWGLLTLQIVLFFPMSLKMLFSAECLVTYVAPKFSFTLVNSGHMVVQVWPFQWFYSLSSMHLSYLQKETFLLRLPIRFQIR